jgi:flagellar basal-body rod modification protein FlgD
MTSPTAGIPGTPATNPAAATPPASKSISDASKNLGDKDTFLKLLVAQLKYQDPDKPADPTQFMAETAQFTQVEKLGDIADLMKSQRLTSASSLVGHSVTYMDENGATLSGVISSAKLNGDSEPMLHIGNTDVLLSKVMEVLPIAGQAGTTGSTAPSRAPSPAAPSGSGESTAPTTGPTTA